MVFVGPTSALPLGQQVAVHGAHALERSLPGFAASLVAQVEVRPDPRVLRVGLDDRNLVFRHLPCEAGDLEVRLGLRRFSRAHCLPQLRLPQVSQFVGGWHLHLDLAPGIVPGR